MLVTLISAIALVLPSAFALPGRCTLQGSNNASAPSSKTLFPVSSNDSWSVSSQVQHALPFDDATLRPTKEAHDFSHPYVNAPDGVYSIKAFYPKGSYNPSGTPRGGLSFYAPGPVSVDLTTAKEATLSYSVLFEDGFDFVMGGKLPGLCTYRESLVFHASRSLIVLSQMVGIAIKKRSRAQGAVATMAASPSVSCGVRTVLASSTPTFPQMP